MAEVFKLSVLTLGSVLTGFAFARFRQKDLGTSFGQQLDSSSNGAPQDADTNTKDVNVSVNLAPPSGGMSHRRIKLGIGLGIVGFGLISWKYKSYYITSEQFFRAYNTLQNQVIDISKMLVRAKTRVFEKFGVVEKRLDDIERTLLTKTAEIRRDLATVETMIANMDKKVDKIEEQTKS